MAIRVRKDGSMWCAAHTARRPGDRYIDDWLHYRLSVELGLIASLPMPCHVIYPRWWRVTRKRARDKIRAYVEDHYEEKE